MWLAYEHGLDLVEVNSQNNPPVCKLIDYKKELYEKAKKTRKQKAKQKAPELKEIKLTFNISEHDFQVRIEKAQKFFAQGNKVRVFLNLRGREMKFQDKAKQLIDKFKQTLNAEYELPIKKQGSRFSALIRKTK